MKGKDWLVLAIGGAIAYYFYQKSQPTLPAAIATSTAAAATPT